MPELCGSTTVSASIVAIAASVALPPARRISTPGRGRARIGGADHALRGRLVAATAAAEQGERGEREQQRLHRREP